MTEELDVVAYLDSKGYRGKQASGSEMVYPCFMDCGESADSKKRKWYLNTDTGFFNCKVCNVSGGSYLLQKFFGDEPSKEAPLTFSVTRREILGQAVTVGQEWLQNNEDVLLYLINERGLEPDTIINRRLGYIGGGWSLTGSLPQHYTRDELVGTGLVRTDEGNKGRDFFYRHLLIPYVHRGSILQVRGRVWGETRGGKYMTGPGEKVYLYNAEDLDDATEAIVCEGEFDAMVLKQHLSRSSDKRVRAIAVVALAGTGAFPDNFESYFANLKRVYIGFDSDKAGQLGAEKVTEKIGKITRIINLPVHNEDEEETGCDWSDFLLPIPDDADSEWKAKHPFAGHTWQDVMHLVGAASGKRVFSVAEAGAAFRAYRVEHDGFTTGYSQIDSTIKPGLLPGQVWVILAKTGAGKSIFLCNLAIKMRRQRTLIVSLEMTREEIYDRLRKIYLSERPEANDSEIDFALSNIFICDENRLGERELDTLLEEFAAEVGKAPEIVHVDYLGYFARAAQGNSQYEKVTNAVMALKAIAKKHRCVIISPSQVNRQAKDGKPIEIDDARDSGAIEETADFLTSLFRPDDAMDDDDRLAVNPTGKIKMKFLKSRHGGKNNMVSLQMDYLTLAIEDDESPAAHRARSHNTLLYQGYSWDDLRREQLAPRQLEMHPRDRRAQ